MSKNFPMISTSSEIMGGTPVFIGTRVPVQTLFDYLEAGESIDDFLEGFPTVTKDQVIALIELIELAEQDTLILKKPDGTEFVLSVIDDFAAEVKALSQNEEFMEFLAQRSRSTKRLSLESAQKRLGI
ncbi:protein of unknown function DUF433 [Microseira wollei NIES-4236]|uniref:DUF433 domain-containing protein n=1 Tax=Microseira wollei NIES-4236 TaxID=2530354 RepID=A0AAV3WJQ9_9CYAN|nr:DUF433 domain-containing protein [Microseira wollei]GET40464.1 protein of unknown function DUF433 [Microseira wollei NIES-4236]